MKLKTVEIEGKTYAEVNESGRVIYDDDGKTFEFDAAETYDKIKQLTGEAKSHREAKELASKELGEIKSKLEGVDLTKLVDSGKIDEAKAEIAKSFQAKIDELQQQNEKLVSDQRSSAVNSAFASSQYIKENLNMPPQVAVKTFAENVTFEDGKMVVKDTDGNPIYSRKKPGSYAEFDEAMGILVDSLPYRNDILRANNHQGSGGDNGGGRAKVITRQEFAGMNPSDQAKVAADMRSGAVELVE